MDEQGDADQRRARPARNMRVGFCRRNIHAASVTKIDARLASRVAFATEVSWIDVCQKARSPANASAAARSSGDLPK